MTFLTRVYFQKNARQYVQTGNAELLILKKHYMSSCATKLCISVKRKKKLIYPKNKIRTTKANTEKRIVYPYINTEKTNVLRNYEKNILNTAIQSFIQ